MVNLPSSLDDHFPLNHIITASTTNTTSKDKAMSMMLKADRDFFLSSSVMV
jgi:hypothetical protein